MITFQDKVAINENPDISSINKITASDMNSIKAGINTNETTINQIKGNILWTNSDPTVNFNDQTIELSSSDYDVLEILYIDYRANQRVQSTKMKKGNSANLTTIFLTGNQLYMATRQMDYVDDTHYTFDNCHSVTNASITTLNTSSPAQCIPMLIIGYKTGAFE